MGKAFAACKDNFRRWLTNPKLYVTFILIVIMQDYIMIASIRSFAREMGVASGRGFIPFCPPAGICACWKRSAPSFCSATRR